ncbi:MAG: PAS domain S-box protein [Bdellovibrionales bacterium]|nr:PAS domain S-box protein [Bdellovibrionales bacterium]
MSDDGISDIVALVAFRLRHVGISVDSVTTKRRRLMRRASSLVTAMRDTARQLQEAASRGGAPSAMVGMGMSEGGYRALRKFLNALPPTTDIALIIVGNSVDEGEPLTCDSLQKAAPLPVEEVTHGQPVAGGRIYLAPSNSFIELRSGIFQVVSKSVADGLRLPIDYFLRSLAKDQRQNAVAVILSGNGEDGTKGVREIKEYGGMVMVQHPNEALHDSMPLHVHETGQADYILPSHELAPTLLRYVEHNTLFDDQTVDIERYARQLRELQHLLKFTTEFDFSQYKPTTLLRRVQHRMGLLTIADLDDYLHFLKDRPTEIEALAQELLICVTSFFRNPEAWRVLQHEVIEKLIYGAVPDEPLRVWIAGCATGEEAYSMAMAFSECLQDHRDLKVQIFASDISNNALKVARAAIYPEAIEADLTPDRLKRFFTREGNGYRVSKSIREMVVFAAHDLKGDPPFFRLDLISCRNLLIYLEPEAQTEVLRKFHFALNPGGHLFLGSSESAGRYEQGYKAVDSGARLYQRIGTSSAAERMLATQPMRQARFRSPPLSRREGPSLRELAADLFWSQSGTVVMLLNEKLQPLYIGGRTERLLQIPQGEQRYTVWDLLRPGLPVKVRSAFEQLQGDTEVRFERAMVRQPDGTAIHVSGILRRVFVESLRTDAIYLQLQEGAEVRQVAALDAEQQPQDDMVWTLERELSVTRQELNSTIEQLEQTNDQLRAAHEEAMSVNEELQSGTEELEASREELQSLNEELTAVNAQLEEKLHELQATNNDLDNLIASTRIAVVFLDTDFRIRNFSAEAVELFKLIRSDIGRPISDLAHTFTDDDFISDAQEVLRTLGTLQREVSALNGERIFSRRLLPYRTQDNRIEGVVATFTDITELKRVQHELALQQEELRLVTDAMPVLISYVDRFERYQFVNARYEDWFGKPANQVVGRTIREVVGAEAYELLRDKVRRVLEGERIVWEARLPYRHGPARYVHVEYVPKRTAKGEVDGYYALVQDITERKDVEEELHRRERDFRSIFHLAGSGKAQFDPFTGRFIRVNERFAEILGYSDEELQDLTDAEITHPEDRAEDQRRIALVVAGSERHWTSEKRYLRKDGLSRWVLVTGTVVRDDDGTPRFAVATTQDITARRLAEEGLRESDERFRALADSMSQLAWMADHLGEATWYNKRWYDFTGATPEECRGAGWEKFQHPDHLPRVKAHIEQCAVRGEQWEDTFPLRRHDGEYRWFLSRAAPLRDETGNVVRWIGTNTDITDQMELERNLKEADQRKNEFLAMLAHELRNPLAPIRTAIDLMLLQSDSPGEPLRIMDGQVKHLVRLVDDLLDVSRITRGKVDLRLEKLKLRTCLEKVLLVLEPALKKREMQLSVDLPEQALWVEGDSIRMAQVFENLISNAIKYGEPGGRISVVAAKERGEAVLRITDDGIGIDPDFLPKVFDLFSQATRSFDRTQGGLGIGLTIVRRLVELHGGSIVAESDGLGHGSSFVVRLPLVAPPKAVLGTGPVRQAHEGCKVLIVDDNESARNLLAELLKMIGPHEVETAADGFAALELLEHFTPQIILLDIGLPEMDGFEVARRIRELSSLEGVQLIALTGYGQEEDRHRSEQAGFDLHLTKPVDLEQLERILGSVCGPDDK